MKPRAHDSEEVAMGYFTVPLDAVRELWVKHKLLARFRDCAQDIETWLFGESVAMKPGGPAWSWLVNANAGFVHLPESVPIATLLASVATPMDRAELLRQFKPDTLTRHLLMACREDVRFYQCNPKFHPYTSTPEHANLVMTYPSANGGHACVVDLYGGCALRTEQIEFDVVRVALHEWEQGLPKWYEARQLACRVFGYWLESCRDWERHQFDKSDAVAEDGTCIMQVDRVHVVRANGTVLAYHNGGFRRAHGGQPARLNPRFQRIRGSTSIAEAAVQGRPDSQYMVDVDELRRSGGTALVLHATWCPSPLPSGGVEAGMVIRVPTPKPTDEMD